MTKKAFNLLTLNAFSCHYFYVLLRYIQEFVRL